MMAASAKGSDPRRAGRLDPPLPAVHPPGHAGHGRPAGQHVRRGGLNTDISKGLADRSRTLPIWRPAPITGALLGDVARYLLAAGLVAGLGLAIGFRPPGGAPGMLAGTGLLLVFALSLSWAWTSIAAAAYVPENASASPTVTVARG
jgi:hypothetical protein